ncbi:phosphonate C-P lyase system protein PhnH [Falsiphaeobacter marinintestinus]|uniref:phosphonate C-P lyase system protein PhnH n=1 Tax=Falsiphaeobacter marinintestinus TaxID=1492905 RepID=UPI0011B634AA|nr:phosphonate C-P lyase system protein PhnH [Phaeobacter marinintestinus]
MNTATRSVFDGGFQDPPKDAARAFRAAMRAMARPGDLNTLTGATPPAPLSQAAAILLLTLCDPDTGVYLAGPCDCEAVRGWLRFHTGAPFVGPAQADFAVGAWDDLLPIDRFRIGTPEYPDRSTTLIVEMPLLDAQGAVLRGPGIKDRATLSLPDVRAMQDNSVLYPLGLDFFLTCADRVAALPRSTQITEV